MASLNSSVVHGSLSVTGEVHGKFDGTVIGSIITDANKAIPALLSGDSFTTEDIFSIDSSGSNIPNTSANWHIDAILYKFSSTGYRVTQIASGSGSAKPTFVYERSGASSDGSSWTFGSWTSLVNTDTKVTQTSKTDNVAYPLLAASSASPTSGAASTAVYDSGVTLNPSTNTIAANISGSAATLTTSRTFQTDLGSTSTASFNGSANVTPGVKGTLGVANGGTGATTAAAARTSLGAASATDVTTIQGLIPSEATSTNQLADKAYVDNMGEKLEARYLGSNTAGDPFATHADLTAATTYYYQGESVTPDTNDITTVTADEDHKNSGGIACVTRYRWNGTAWAFEYVINNSGLTTAQQNAINSGITSTKVSGYDSHLSNKSNPHGVTYSQVGAAAASHTHSSLSASLLTSTDDLNSLMPDSRMVQTYYWESTSYPANLPSAAQNKGGLLIVYETSGANYGCQEVIVGSQNYGTFRRHRVNGTWDSWKTVYYEATSTYSSTGTQAVNGTAVASAIGGLDATITSTDGTNVQVKVTETNGKVTAVNITTDNTASKTHTHAITDVTNLESTLSSKATPADITEAIEALDVTDTAADNKFVTAVSETDGKISVSRAALTATNVAQAGTLSNSTTGNAATASAAQSGSALATAISGKVTANTAITGATKTKITYDSKGLVTAGADLAASDIPSLDASKITSGTFATARIADDAITAAKVKDGDTLPVNITGSATLLTQYSIPYHRPTASSGDEKQWTRIAYKTVSNYATGDCWGCSDLEVNFYQASYGNSYHINIGRLVMASRWGHAAGSGYSFKTSGDKLAYWEYYNPSICTQDDYTNGNDAKLRVKCVCSDITIEWWVCNSIWDTAVYYTREFYDNMTVINGGDSNMTNDDFVTYCEDKLVKNVEYGKQGTMYHLANSTPWTNTYNGYKEVSFDSTVTWADFIAGASNTNSLAYKLYGSTFDTTEKTINAIGRLNLASNTEIKEGIGIGLAYPIFHIVANRQYGYIEFQGETKIVRFQFNRYGAIGGKLTTYGDITGNAATATSATTATNVSATEGTVSANRHVWFSDSNTETKRAYDGDFMYNPSTNVLTVGSITGNAATATSATNDSDGNAINSTYLKLSGGTMTGALTIQNTASGSTYAQGGGAFHNGYVNAILRGNSSTGSSGILFTSSKGTTSINQTSDRAFIQYHPYGISKLTAEATNPTIGTSGENGCFVIGVGNDGTDLLYLQTPSETGIRHIMGTVSSTMLDTLNMFGRLSTRIDARCSTAAATAAKTAPLDYYSLRTGSVIRLRLDVTNTSATALTLNVNSTGAKTISTLTADNTWTATSTSSYTLAGGYYDCLYNGSNWLMLPTASSASTIDPSVAILSGQASYANKNVFVPGFNLAAGSRFKLRIDTDNTSATALLLNVNNTGAKPIYVNNTATSETSYTLAANWYDVYYDGTNYYVNTTSELPVRAVKDGSGNTITSTYLKLSGGTMTGAITFGDDVYIGDCNSSGQLGIKGKNNNTGIRLVPYSGSTVNTITNDGAGNVTISGTTKGTFSGNLTGDVTGNCSGSSGSCTGNAATASTWATARNFTIKDASATNAGTATAVQGDADEILLLPSTIKATLDGNASSATYASALAFPGGRITNANVNNTSRFEVLLASLEDMTTGKPSSDGWVMHFNWDSNMYASQISVPNYSSTTTTAKIQFRQRFNAAYDADNAWSAWGAMPMDITGNAATATSATSATNVALSGSVKTTSTTDGDTIQFQAGSGTAGTVTIVNAKHAASSDSATSATKATGDSAGTNILQNYMKASAGSKSLSWGSSTTIGTVNGSNVQVTLPSNPNTDTKQNITLATTTKAYITGVATTPTSTAAALTGLADTGVYLTTTAGQMNATSYKVSEKGVMQYNSTDDCIEFTFA